jgi:hypothetical protein
VALLEVLSNRVHVSVNLVVFDVQFGALTHERHGTMSLLGLSSTLVMRRFDDVSPRAHQVGEPIFGATHHRERTFIESGEG